MVSILACVLFPQKGTVGILTSGEKLSLKCLLEAEVKGVKQRDLTQNDRLPPEWCGKLAVSVLTDGCPQRTAEVAWCVWCASALHCLAFCLKIAVLFLIDKLSA